MHFYVAVAIILVLRPLDYQLLLVFIKIKAAVGLLCVFMEFKKPH